jgi:hypothetical protein
MFDVSTCASERSCSRHRSPSDVPVLLEIGFHSMGNTHAPIRLSCKYVFVTVKSSEYENLDKSRMKLSSGEWMG